MATSRLLVNIEANSAKLVTEVERSRKSIQGMSADLKLIKFDSIINLGERAFQVAKQLREFAEMGAKVRSIEESFTLVARNSGVAIDSLISNLKKVTAETIDDSDLMKKATRLIAEGFSPDQITTLGAASRTAARLMGTDVASAYEQISDAVVNLRARGLKTAGFVIDLEEAYAKHAKTLGVNKDELNDYGKQMAIVNAIKEKNIELTKQLGIDQLSEYEQLQKEKTAWQELTEEVGKYFSKLYSGRGMKEGYGSTDPIQKQLSDALGLMERVNLEEHGRGQGRVGAVIPNVPSIKSQLNVEDEKKRLEREKKALEDNAKAWGESADAEFEFLNKMQQDRVAAAKEEKTFYDTNVQTMTDYLKERQEIEGEMVLGAAANQAEIAEINKKFEADEWEKLAKHADLIKELRGQLDNVKTGTDSFMSSFSSGLSSAWSTNLTGMLKGTTKFSDGIKNIFTGMADSVISSLGKILANMALFGNMEGRSGTGGGLMGILGSVVGVVGGLLGSTSTPSYSSMNWGGGADYSSFGYVEGGVAMTPQISELAAKGPEAVIPLDKLEGSSKKEDQPPNVTNFNIMTLDVSTMEQWVRKNSKLFVDVNVDNIRRGGQLAKAVRGA